MSAQRESQVREHLAAVRETVESIWIAIVLAFMLRAFVLEAFVIPTGSMAPRLMGQHWQFDCPACGYHYAYGIPQSPGRSMPDISAELGSAAPAVCPNCQYRHGFGKAWAYGGDRVLVLKYLYRFREPRSWDVVVFKNPQDNLENYIKRLIGLPGQQLEIVHGDVFVRELKDDLTGDGVIDEDDFAHPRARSESRWRILRKPAKTQQTMWQVIFDADYPPNPAEFAAESQSWADPWRPQAAGDVWNRSADGGRVFSFAGSEAPAEMRFLAERRRFCPNYAYNKAGDGLYDPEKDVNSDLKLSFMFVPGSPQAKIGLHLSSFEHHFRAWVSADGSCVLRHGVTQPDGKVLWDQGDKDPWAFDRIRPLEPGRGYEITLTHVDRRVSLWVNGKDVLATTDAQYGADREQIVRAVEKGVPTPTVAILGQGGSSQLWHVRLLRDVYYTCANTYGRDGHDTGRPGWATTGRPMVLRKFPGKPGLDEFFVLGDNSPASKDSRMWGYHAATLREGYRDGTVPRYNLIGKAFFVYWAGGFRLPLLRRLPIVPNVGRMRLIR